MKIYNVTDVHYDLFFVEREGFLFELMDVGDIDSSWYESNHHSSIEYVGPLRELTSLEIYYYGLDSVV